MTSRLAAPFPSPRTLRDGFALMRRTSRRASADGVPDGIDPLLLLLVRRSLRPGQLVLAVVYPCITIGVPAVLPPMLPWLHIYVAFWWAVVSIAAIWPVLDHVFHLLGRLKATGTLRELILSGHGARTIGDALTGASFVLILLPMWLMLSIAPLATAHFAPGYHGTLAYLYTTFHRLQWLAIPYSAALMMLTGTTAWWTVVTANGPGARGWFVSVLRTAALAVGAHLLTLPITTVVLRSTHREMADWRLQEQFALGASVNVLPATIVIVVMAALLARRAIAAWPVAVASGQFDEGG